MIHKNYVVKTLQIKSDGTLRVLIPKEIREELNIQAGDELIVNLQSNKIIYSKVNNK